MKQIFSILFAALIFSACTPKYQSLPMDEFEKAIQDPDVVIIDTRTPQEYAEGHIAGAVNIDWKAGNFAEEVAVYDKNQTIAVYCIHARRSKLAAECLQELGYKHIIELAEGLEVWINAGKPIVKD